jgi:DNA-directed RNA polymerase subunit RPC12/RpoP
MLALASQGRKIQLRCRECGHRRILDPIDMGAAYGDSLTMEALWRRATCAQCGSRKHVIQLWPGPD